MKKKLGLIIAGIFLLSLFAFAACELVPKYTVTFDTQGGSAVASQSVLQGGKATEPKDPTFDGKAFVGWSTNKSTNDPFDFGTKITKDTTVYAIWQDVVIPPPVESGLKVGMFWYRQEDLYLSSVRSQVNDVFNGMNFVIKNFYAQNSDATLYNLVRSNIDDLDILFVNPVDGTNTANLNAIVKLASDAGKPVVFFNKEVNDSVIADYVNAYYIGTVSKQAGVQEGVLMANFLLQDNNAAKYASTDTYNGNIGGYFTDARYAGDGLTVYMSNLKVIYYAMLRGQEGHADSDARTYWSVMQANTMLVPCGYILRPSPLMAQSTSFNLAANPVGSLGLPLATQEEKDIFNKFVGANDEWDGNTANNNFQYAFANALSNPSTLKNSLGVIFSNWDGGALAVINGTLKDYGYNLANTDQSYDASKYIPIVGVDGDPANLDLIANGRQTGTVIQSSRAYAQLFLYYCYALSDDMTDANTFKNSPNFVPDGYFNALLSKKVFFNYGIVVKN